MTRAVSLMKPRVGLIFIVIENLLIFLLLIYIIISLAIEKSNKNHNKKEDRRKYLIDETLEKFGTEIILTHTVGVQLENELDFFPSGKFVIVHSSTRISKQTRCKIFFHTLCEGKLRS